MRKLPVLFKFVVFRQSLVVNLKVQLSFTVSLDCLVNKNNVFLFVYSINILPLTVTNDAPRVHSVNKCSAHIYASTLSSYKLLLCSSLKATNRTYKPIKTRRQIRAQHVLILVDCEERASKWLWTLK